MKPFLVFLFFIFFSTINAQKQFKITGILEGFDENSIVLIQKQNITIDSCNLNNKKFELKGTLEEVPANVYLIVKSGQTTKYANLYIGNENITLNSKSEDFPYDVKTKGSIYDNERYLFAQKEKLPNIERKELLSKMWDLRDQKKWNDSLQKQYWSQEEPKGLIVKIDENLEKIRNQFIAENINSYFGLSLLETYKTEINNSEIKLLLKKVNPKFSKSIYIKSINSHLNNPDLKIGEKFYDFTAYNQHQKQTKFSNYFNEKFILLDFSTLYCGWCLKAIPLLEKLQDQNMNKLDVITFYVDKNIKGFEGLGKKHSNNWNILWDREGRFSDTYAKYKVFGTPTFYLFTPQGKLLKKFDGYSEDMLDEIEKLIN